MAIDSKTLGNYRIIHATSVMVSSIAVAKNVERHISHEKSSDLGIRLVFHRMSISLVFTGIAFFDHSTPVQLHDLQHRRCTRKVLS